jgi:hypothetical protein
MSAFGPMTDIVSRSSIFTWVTGDAATAVVDHDILPYRRQD